MNRESHQFVPGTLTKQACVKCGLVESHEVHVPAEQTEIPQSTIKAGLAAGQKVEGYVTEQATEAILQAALDEGGVVLASEVDEEREWALGIVKEMAIAAKSRAEKAEAELARLRKNTETWGESYLGRRT